MSNFMQRLAQAARYTFFGGKALATIVPTWQEGKPVYSLINFETMVREGWRTNELIYACISKTANTAAQMQITLKDQRGEPFEEHPFLDLMRRPNPHMSEFDFWSAVIIFQKLAGIAYFEKVRSRSGAVVELWPLRPDWLKPLASRNDFIAGYEYTVPGDAPVPIKAQDVLRFPLWDPLNMYQGWPPAAVAARVGDVDNNATDYMKLFFEKGGTPPGILKSKLSLSEDDVTQLRARWRDRYGGIMGWIDPAVLDMDAEYQAIGSTFKDMGFDGLDARNEARICAVLQVPPILVGAKIGLDRATYANYREARSAWWEDDLMPMYFNFQDVLDNQLAPEFGEGLNADWDYDGVYAIQEQKARVQEMATTALKEGGITVNEFRDQMGLEPVGPAGDVFVRSTATVEIPMNGERPKPEPLQLTPAKPAADDEAKGLGMVLPPDWVDAVTANLKAAGNAPDDAERRRHERLVIQALGKDFFPEQMKRVLKDARNGRH